MTESADGAMRIAQWVSGFQNYESHGQRGASDEALRAYLLERIKSFSRALANLAQEIEAMGLGVEEARTALRILSDRLADIGDSIRSTPYAFGEFMTAPSLNTKTTASFYDRDECVLRELSAIQALVDPTLTEQTDVGKMVDELGKRIHGLKHAVIARQDAISEYTSSAPAS